MIIGAGARSARVAVPLVARRPWYPRATSGAKPRDRAATVSRVATPGDAPAAQKAIRPTTVKPAGPPGASTSASPIAGTSPVSAVMLT